jgi:hypothetical protein
VLTRARGPEELALAQLGNAIASFSAMAATIGPVLEEADINPIIVTPQAAIAVDALVVPRGKRYERNRP